MAATVSAYLEEQAGAHPFDASLKIVMLAVYSVGIFFVDAWAGMAAYAALLLAFGAALRAPWGKVASLGVPVYVIAGLTVVFNAVQPVGAGLGSAPDGLVRGCFFAARILLLVWFSLVVCFTTQATEVTQAFAAMMGPLRRAKVPVDDVAMVFSIALRFIPQMAEEYFQIRDAQWSRGAEFDEGPVAARVRAHCAILVPMFVGLFRRADRLAASMDARCYGMANVRRCNLRASRLRPGAVAAAAAGCALCAAVAVLL